MQRVCRQSLKCFFIVLTCRSTSSADEKPVLVGQLVRFSCSQVRKGSGKGRCGMFSWRVLRKPSARTARSRRCRRPMPKRVTSIKDRLGISIRQQFERSCFCYFSFDSFENDHVQLNSTLFFRLFHLGRRELDGKQSPKADVLPSVPLQTRILLTNQ